MVFQSALSYLLNKYLGEFVENLDEKQLNVGIWGGNIELKDLIIRPSALEELDIPVQCTYGKIGKLILKIPWKSLYTERTIITVEDVYFLAQPNQQVKYDPVKDEQTKLDFKRKELARIEEAKRISEEQKSGKVAKQGWTAEFAEKLVTTVIKNLQLNICRIHFRYEDKITNPEQPFSFGFTLDELAVESTDANWEKVLSEDLVKIFKILHLNNLGVYLNCNSTIYGDLSTLTMVEKLKTGIATLNEIPEHYRYILGPINASARLKMNQKPELDEPPYSIPKFHFNLQMDTLYVGLDKCQYQDIIALVDSMERMERGVPFRKFRPNVTSYKGHYREWWRFAITSVLECDVRRRRREWDWNHIKNYREMCREYCQLYNKKLNKKCKEYDNARIDEIEKLLHITNLVIIREQAQAEIRRMSDSQEKKGWIDWIWGGSGQSKDNNGDSTMSKLKKEMTPEEKQQLYQAIDYQDNTGPLIYPEPYVAIVCTFLLKNFIVELSDVEGKTNDRIVVFNLDLNTVKCRLETRPALQGISVKVKIDDLTGVGFERNDFTPYIVSSEAKSGAGLLDILYEKNPLDKQCDQRVHVTALPLRIVYDAKTINKLVDVFTIPPDSSVNQLQDAAANRITEMKEMSALGLQYTLEKHQVLDIDVDFEAPYLVMPYGGKFTGDENVIVVDLGNIKVKSLGRKADLGELRAELFKGLSQDEMLNYMQENAYDKFSLEMTRLQILVAQSDEDWKKTLHAQKITSMHLLQPVNLSINFSKSLITDDPRLPLTKIHAEIPSINIVVSDARLMLAIALLTSVDFPNKNDADEEFSLRRYPSSSSMHSLLKDIQMPKSTTLLPVEEVAQQPADNAEFIQLQATFVMAQFTVTINEQQLISDRAVEMAKFSINTITCEMKQFPSVLKVEVNLVNMDFNVERENQTVKVIETPQIDGRENTLFKIKFTQVDPKHPDLHSVYHSCENSLALNFGNLSLTVHKEAILCILQFYSNIQDQLLPAQNDQIGNKFAAAKSLTRTISNSSSIHLLSVGKPSKKKRSSRVNETIKFKFAARLEEVTVKLSEDYKEIAKVSIAKCNVVTITKETYTQVNAVLGDFCVQDLNRLSAHKDILTQLEDESLQVQLVINNLENEDNTSDLKNMEVTVYLGRTRIVFLNWFVSNIMTYLNQFQVAQEAIANASAAATEAAANNMKDVYVKAQKIALNIELKAPIILVPINSKSYDALYLDLGVITLQNEFINLDVKNDSGFPGVIDDLTVKLDQLKILRAHVDEYYTIVEEHIILEPTNLKLSIKRNLSISWYTAIPDIDVSGKISKIQVNLSNVDYQGIMHILNGNLAEGRNVEPAKSQTELVRKDPNDPLKSHVTFSKAEMAKEILSASKPTPKPHVSLKFTFSMEQFVIMMYYKRGATIQTGLVRSDESKFAKFELEGLSVKGKMLTDNSMVTSVLFLKCTMDDIRPNRNNTLNRIIDKSPEKHGNARESKSMIDVTYQQRNDDAFVDVRIFSFTIVVSMEYLMKFSDYFAIPDQDAGKVESSKVSKQSGKKPAAAPSAGQLTLNLKLEKPDIILVEHMENNDAKAVVFNAEILLKYRQSGVHQVVSGIIKDCELYRSVYNPEFRSKYKVTIIHPLEISLAGSTPPEQGLHLELLVANIFINVSPQSIELLNQVLSGFSVESKTNLQEDNEFNYVDLWNPKPFTEADYWFLSTEVATDVLELSESDDGDLQSVNVLEEICIISVPLISVIIEGGDGSKTQPLIVFETGFKGNVKNWSSNMTVEASLTMQMAYYNNTLAMWEPLVEPQVINESTYTPWELKVEVAMSQPDRLTSKSSLGTVSSPTNVSDTDFESTEIDIPKPLLSIGLFSDKTLEVTVTKTLLEMVEYLQKIFSAALDKDAAKAVKDAVAPFRVINELGEDVALLLEDSAFTNMEASDSDFNKTVVPLQLKDAYRDDDKLMLSKAMMAVAQLKCYSLKIEINSVDSTLILPVSRADKRYFPLNHRTNFHENWGIISDIAIEHGITTILLRSIVQVHNDFNIPVDVYFRIEQGSHLELISQIPPKGKLNVPLKAVYTPSTELFFGVADFSFTTAPFAWKELQTNLKVVKKLQCFPKNAEKENVPFVIQAIGELEQVYYEQTNRHTMTSTCYNIHLKPCVSFMNYLPVTVVCCVDESPDEFTVEPGDSLQLPTIEPGSNFLVIRIPNYLEKMWSCRKEVNNDPDEFNVWTFYSYDSASKMALDLGIHVEKEKGALLLTLYCPFWMINKTGLLLSYRKSKKGDKNDPTSSPQSSDDSANVLYHPAEFEGPVLFSFAAKNFFGKKKASIRIENGQWSDKFSIDVAGSSGTVTCKFNEQLYEVGVQNNLTSNGLTKQITFVPYYIVINEAPFAVECQEYSRPADPWSVIEPKSCSPLWPKDTSQDKLMRIRVKDTDECSAPFLYTDSHTTLLKLDNKFGGLNVDIQLTEGGILINVAPYEDGSAPALLLNHSDYTLCYWEKESVQKRYLQPNESVLYTWENPSGPRQLVWDRGNRREIIEDLRKDKYGEFSPKDGVYVYWTSFLDGMQRILLFTKEHCLAESAQASNILEQIQQEIDISMHGIGLSLVNNVAKQEVMYVGIASSGVLWETAKINSERYKYMDKRASDVVEAAYQQLVLDSVGNSKQSWLVQVDSKTEIDFKAGRMNRPQKRKIRRSFLPGLWLQLKTSPSQVQIHAKINRLQIDNQLYDCFFPVVLAPVPLPKSVASETIKPFIEVSIVQLLMKNSQIRQFKYFKVLVQEFHVKMDIGFVNALVEMFSASEYTPEQLKQQFLLDKEKVGEDLYQLAAMKSIQQQKSFYDLLHFSPLKIHVSFSLASSGNSSEQSSTPRFVNVLLQGLGVTLTDVNDVVFKLAFFERNFSFLTQSQLINEASKHYMGQFIKQFYVLILGLDVIGNPYGLVLGITKGVEDLFYEPFQGAIQGPGEFVEGLSLGVKSLFGHTVGGAAGAVSKITGAMGKGIAALTFDEDFQRKRREQKNRKPHNAQEGLARSGKGVVMGFYSGVTGVFTKPVEGAKESGVEGFFKGLGKGAVGLVTRPVAGVVDFASESFDVVKRAAEGQNEAVRLRAPRFIQTDGLLKPYNRTEAIGNKYLHSLSKGRYAKTDVYVAHYDIVEDKEVLMLTNQRIAYITHSDMFGHWQTDWQFTWDEITAPAKVNPKGVLIQFTERKKKVFSSGEFAKVLLIPNPKVREEICQRIESLRTA
ncbi:unnamed protein product [Phyllotreta striolata]|uniref:Vacuolar protein sorting-associated protein n=1 Tax=Phyllotreta striolata TaxID=444603 RepID=A0A9N9TZS0_PHYSR|nr:unnamed protein product [Phyllotreta striolata]